LTLPSVSQSARNVSDGRFQVAVLPFHLPNPPDGLQLDAHVHLAPADTPILKVNGHF
jgi:hypothetical protein